MIKLIREEFSNKEDVIFTLKNIFKGSSCKTPEVKLLKRSITLVFNVGGIKHPKTTDDTEDIFNILEENGFQVQNDYSTTGVGGPRGWGNVDFRVSIANPLYQPKEYNDNEYRIINTLDKLCGTYKGIMARDKDKVIYIVPVRKTNDGYLICSIYNNSRSYRADEFESYKDYCNKINNDVSIGWLLKRIETPLVIKSFADMKRMYDLNRSENNTFT